MKRFQLVTPLRTVSRLEANVLGDQHKLGTGGDIRIGVHRHVAVFYFLTFWIFLNVEFRGSEFISTSQSMA